MRRRRYVSAHVHDGRTLEGRAQPRPQLRRCHRHRRRWPRRKRSGQPRTTNDATGDDALGGSRATVLVAPTDRGGGGPNRADERRWPRWRPRSMRPKLGHPYGRSHQRPEGHVVRSGIANPRVRRNNRHLGCRTRRCSRAPRRTADYRLTGAYGPARSCIAPAERTDNAIIGGTKRTIASRPSSDRATQRRRSRYGDRRQSGSSP